MAAIFPLDPLGDAVQGYGAAVLNYALVLAAVATLVMALVELVKTMIRLRLRYHRWSVQSWTSVQPRRLGGLMRQICTYRPAGRPSPFMLDNRTLDELLLLATGGHDDGDALYDQPIEKMMAQVQAAANIAVQFPQDYPHLYRFLTGIQWTQTPKPKPPPVRKKKADAKDQAEPDAADQAKRDEQALAVSVLIDAGQRQAIADHAMRAMQAWPAAARAKAARAAVPAAPAPPVPPAVTAAEEAAAKTKINNLVQRKLDAFQTETQFLWDRLNQWVATILCAVMLYWLLIEAGTLGWLLPIPLAMIGGVTAPFAKDVASALASFGKAR